MFLVNTGTGTVHNLDNLTERCNTDDIERPRRFKTDGSDIQHFTPPARPRVVMVYANRQEPKPIPHSHYGGLVIPATEKGKRPRYLWPCAYCIGDLKNKPEGSLKDIL